MSNFVSFKSKQTPQPFGGGVLRQTSFSQCSDIGYEGSLRGAGVFSSCFNTRWPCQSYTKHIEILENASWGRGLFPHADKLLFIELGVNCGVGNGCVTKVNLYGPYIMAVVYHKEPATMP